MDNQSKSTESKLISTDKGHILTSWPVFFLKLIVLAGLALLLGRPAGSVCGRVVIEEPGFENYTFDMRDHRVAALAIGPLGKGSQERGVFVSPDGKFQIDQLPVGEYTIRVRATGFGTEIQTGIFVQEGKVVNLEKKVALHILDPTVNIASNCRVYTSKECPRFWLNASGANKAKVKVYRKNMLSVLSAAKSADNPFEVSSYLGLYPDKSLAGNAELFAKEKPVKVFERSLVQDVEDWAHADFRFDKPLAKGDYFAVAEVSNQQGKTDWNIFYFSVSDLGMVVKRCPRETLVRTIDLTNLQARSGVGLEFFERSNGVILSKPFMSVKTGKDGFAKVSTPQFAKLKESKDFIVIAKDNEDFAYDGASLWLGDSSRYETYFYTDKPVYRLGQKVLFKGISRLIDGDDYKNPGKNMSLSVQVVDPDDNPILDTELETDAFGCFNGSVDIPASAKTGAYGVNITYPDDTKAYKSFEIAQYRKPEYEVKVTPLASKVVAGNKAKVKVSANYYFGAPVSSAKVKYTIYSSIDYSSRYQLEPRPAYYAYFDGWDEEYYDDEYGGDFIKEGYAQLDENGEAIIEFDTRKIELSFDSPPGDSLYDRRYKVEAEVTDLSRLTVLSSGSILATKGDFALFVQPDRYIAKAGEDFPFTLSAIDYDGQPVANQKVKVQLARYIYDSKTQTYIKRENKDTLELTTDSKGMASGRMPSANQYPTDTYYLWASALDQSGNLICDQSSIWIASANYPYVLDAERAKSEPLKIDLDKKVYMPGETARVMISAPVTGSEGYEAVVSVEDAQIYDYRVVKLSATAQMIEVPIKENYSPNIFVSVALVAKNHTYYYAEQSIYVSPKNHFLNLSISTDKDQYKPGEEIEYTIQAKTAQGENVGNVELSLGVVDESIYAIRPETAPDIKKAFFRKRYNQVQTSCSFPEEYSGGPDKLEPRVRKDFRDTAVFIPSLITDKQGMAKAKVKLPDNLTTWRATVRGIDMATNVGSCVNKVVSTQELIVRMGLPRFYTLGDQSSIACVVHNFAKQKQNISLELKPSAELELLMPAKQTLEVLPDTASRIIYPVRARAAGTANITIKAIGQTSADAYETKVPINDYGLEKVDFISGLMASVQKALSIPFDLSAMKPGGLATLTVSMSGSLLADISQGIDALLDYKYGCVEQTTSKLAACTAASRLKRDFGYAMPADLDKKLSALYNESILKLSGYQNSNGGFGWWQGGESRLYLTTYVLDGLYNLREIGYVVSPEMLNNALAFVNASSSELERQLSDPKHVVMPRHDRDLYTQLAHATFIQNEYAKQIKVASKNSLLAKLARIGFFKKHFKQLPPECLAYLTLSGIQKSASQDEKLLADQAVLRLVELSNQFGDLASFEHSKKLCEQIGLYNKEDDGFDDYSYLYTGVESTAIAVRALSSYQLSTGDSKYFALVSACAQWLTIQEGRFDQGGWSTTKGSAAALEALYRTQQLRGKPAVGDLQSIVSIAGQCLGSNKNDVDVISSSGANFLSSLNPDKLVSDSTKFLIPLRTSFENLIKPIMIKLTLPVAKGEVRIENSEPVEGQQKQYVNYNICLKQFVNKDFTLRSLGNAPGGGAVESSSAANTASSMQISSENSGTIISSVKGLKISRQFCRLVPTSETFANSPVLPPVAVPIGQDKNSKLVLKAIPLANNEARSGETLLMKIEIDSPTIMPYLIVEANLPSGAEFVERSVDNLDQQDDNSKDSFSADWDNVWWSHRDYLDDKVVFFIESLPKGKSFLYAYVRAELPGNYNVNSVKLNTMYNDRINAAFIGDKLSVK